MTKAICFFNGVCFGAVISSPMNFPLGLFAVALVAATAFYVFRRD